MISPEYTPLAFNDLSPERYQKLEDLFEDYLDQLQKGLLLVANGALEIEKKLTEISELAGMPSSEVTMQLLNTINLLAISSKTKSEFEEKIMLAVKGHSSTEDPKVIRVMRFVGFAGSKIWSRREQAIKNS